MEMVHVNGSTVHHHAPTQNHSRHLHHSWSPPQQLCCKSAPQLLCTFGLWRSFLRLPPLHPTPHSQFLPLQHGYANKFSWAAMIGGFAAHGYANKAIECLERMQVEDGIKPDGIVILEVLAACTHAGLSEEGQSLLNNMERLYGVQPEYGHYSCVVDLLCRAGQFHQALELIRSMPMKPMASVWGAFLSGCRMHNNVILAELAVRKLLETECGNEAEENSAFVQLSNIYFASRKCEDVRRIRRMIGDRGLKKAPGCSAIEIDGKVNEFVAGDVSHNFLPEIYAILELVSIDLSIDPAWQMRVY